MCFLSHEYQQYNSNKFKGKKGHQIISGGLLKKSATTYSPANAVPSALMGLTSLFGMVRGGTPLL
jgi:hypothetical protein